MTPRSREEFTLRGPDDFVRLDSLCAALLGDFFAWLQAAQGGALAPEEASVLAHAADRYLRDFVVDIQEAGPADPDPALPRQYLGNWYIVNTLEPTHDEIDRNLKALAGLYRFLLSEGIVDEPAAEAAARELADGQYFHRRLEDFWALTPERITAWREENDYRGKSRLRKRGEKETR